LPEIIDASSKYQDSLPVTSDDVLALLDAWGIAYTRADHVPLRTVEDSKKVQDMFLPSEEGGGHIKNLYLRDNKKRNYLIVAEQECAPGCGYATFDDQWGEIECSDFHGR